MSNVIPFPKKIDRPVRQPKAVLETRIAHILDKAMKSVRSDFEKDGSISHTVFMGNGSQIQTSVLTNPIFQKMGMDMTTGYIRRIARKFKADFIIQFLPVALAKSGNESDVIMVKVESYRFDFAAYASICVDANGYKTFGELEYVLTPDNSPDSIWVRALPLKAV